MSRSKIQMLRVVAMHFDGNAPAELVKTIRKFSRELEVRATDGRYGDVAKNKKRIEWQRTLFNMLPSSSETDKLKAAMLQRAYDLMYDGHCDSCDAIVEFLPSGDVDRMFQAWEHDWSDSEEKSDFYRATEPGVGGSK